VHIHKAIPVWISMVFHP